MSSNAREHARIRIVGDQFGLGDRPSKLPNWLRGFILLLIGLTFASGVALWQQNLSEELPVFQWRRIHGVLFAFNCVLFGFLLCEHIRFGWKTKANLVSGALFELLFIILIFTGLLFYYGPEGAQEIAKTVHLICGLCMPLALGVHWVCAVNLVRRLEKK